MPKRKEEIIKNKEKRREEEGNETGDHLSERGIAKKNQEPSQQPVIPNKKGNGT